MSFRTFAKAGHAPTLFSSFLYFDLSFMVWVLLGPLGVAIAGDLKLDAAQKGLMVAIPVLSGAFLRVLAGLAVHAKRMADEPFIEVLPAIEAAAGDGRNFVKKAVNWALRGIGKRNAALREAAIACAQRPARLVPAEALGGGDHRHEIEPIHGGKAGGLLLQGLHVEDA